MLHNWKESLYIGAARLDGLPYVTQVQEWKCRTCGEIISLPDCRRQTCRALMSLGCKGAPPPPPKEPWKSPMRERPVDKKDYPAKRKKGVANDRR